MTILFKSIFIFFKKLYPIRHCTVKPSTQDIIYGLLTVLYPVYYPVSYPDIRIYLQILCIQRVFLDMSSTAKNITVFFWNNNIVLLLLSTISMKKNEKNGFLLDSGKKWNMIL